MATNYRPGFRRQTAKTSKLKKPVKYIKQPGSKIFYDWQDPYYHEKKVSLNDLLTWLKTNLPKKAKDVEIEIEQNWCYDDCAVNLVIIWTEKVPNPKYQQQLKKYLRLKSK